MMQIYEKFRSTGGCAAALGYFDGVHRGHRMIIDRARTLAADSGLSCAVLSFAFDGERLGNKGGLDILTRSQKHEKLAEAGVDICFEPPFSTIRDTPPETFVASVLAEQLGVKRAVCGADYTFGALGQGGAAQLAELCAWHGIECEICEKLRDGDEEISARGIKSMLTAGDVEGAARLLGYRYYINEPVVSGAALGRKIGWPTLNQHWPRVCALKNGVYATRALIAGEWRAALSNVGVRPTFYDSGELLCETHLLDTQEVAAHSLVRVEFVGFIREERRFENARQLSDAIARDACQAANKLLQLDK